jgi:3-hydroxyisobutyrate dehydrogenase-like beta-hydroxyacid dehydrogenase
METGKALAQAVEVLCTCVRTDDDLRAMVTDCEVFDGLGSGGVFVIHSTVHPNLCRELAAAGEQKGVDVLDAGVSGSVQGALSRNLPVTVGGSRTAFDRVLPVLETYGNPVRYFGPSGRGMEAKLVNNLLSIAQFELAAATLELGEALGFERETLRETMLAGSGGSFGLKNVERLLSSTSSPTLIKKDYDHIVDVLSVSLPSFRSNKAAQTLDAVAHELVVRLGAA